MFKSIFNRDKKTKKPLKLKNPFNEIWIDINDIDYPEQTKSYSRFRLEHPDDQIFICDGNIYVIDKRCIEKLNKYNPNMDILHGFTKLKEILSFKRIGFLDFKYENGTDNIIFPINRESIIDMIQPVKPSPALLKVLTESKKYESFIRTLPKNEKSKMELKGKGIYIIVIIIVALVVGLFATGIIDISMLGVKTP